MDIGVGLPSHLPGVAGKTVIEWARRAEALGFDSLAVIDRIVYPNFEPLMTLGAAAAVTERIRLVTAILIGPYRTNTALLAKEIGTLEALSGGRLVLGMAVGGREDDYTGSGVSFEHKGRRLEAQIAEMRRIWDGESRGVAGAIGPKMEKPPQIIIGGQTEPALKRAVRIADGWIMGGTATPENFKPIAERLRAAWHTKGRPGRPWLQALNYYALGGADALAVGQGHARDYYGFAGPYAERVAQSMAGTEAEIKRRIAGFEQAGCDELIMLPQVPELAQLERLAAAVSR